LPLPEAIRNAPSLWLGLELYYNAFLELCTCRQIGNAVGAIPLTSVIEYCKAFEIEGEQQEDLLWLIQRLDHKYLEWVSKRVKP
jgi:hypothetical protein